MSSLQLSVRVNPSGSGGQPAFDVLLPHAAVGAAGLWNILPHRAEKIWLLSGVHLWPSC